MPLTGKFFVTGTDTDSGKTWVSCRLLEQAAAEGLSCYGIKPLAAGSEETAEGLRNQDALDLMGASTEKLDYELVNPVALREPVAPHIAVSRERRAPLSASRLAGHVRGALATHPADLILVEGAGGWRVPLNASETLAAVPRELDLPVILVVGMKLGCISHALLTAEAIRNDGLELAGWIANRMPPPMRVLEENIDMLEQLIPAPRIEL